MSLQSLGSPEYINVARGLVPGMSRLQKVGYNTGVGTADTTVWNETTTPVAYPATAATITISSSSANDTTAGTGARTVTITGLDATFRQFTEVITLTGQTAVTTIGLFYRVNNMTVTTAGSGGVNAGVIYAGTGTVTVGKPATIYNSIGIGFNRSLSGFTTIPLGMTGYLVSFGFTTNQIVVPTATITVKALTRTNGGIFNTTRVLVGSGDLRMSALPTLFVTGTDLEIRAFVSAATAVVTADFEILLTS